MSLLGKSFVALGFAEALAGVFTAAVVGDPSPAIGGISLGVATLTGGIALDAAESQKPQPVPVPVSRPK